MSTTYMSVHKDKMGIFHEILCSTNGRYIKNPVEYGDMVYVHFEHDDSTEFWDEWNRYCINIVEVNKITKVTKLTNRVRLFIRNLLGRR